MLGTQDYNANKTALRSSVKSLLIIGLKNRREKDWELGTGGKAGLFDFHGERGAGRKSR